MAKRQAGVRADLLFGLFWTALGLGILVESWRMDRLETQGINPYTAPGLVPGLLGAVLAVFGLVLARRSRLGRPSGDVDAPPAAEESPTGRAEPWRAALALALCLGFGLGLLGSGVPFPLAAGLFLFLSVFLFELPDRRREGTVGRGALSAAAFAACAAAAVTFVFQELFLVRLP
jgi:Tripartite tricarboxylate transporter TctB family